MNLASTARNFRERLGKDARLTARVVLGVLVAANLVAAAALFRPWGGSPEQLQQQLTALRGRVQQSRATAQRLNTLVRTVEKTRAESDQFLENLLSGPSRRLLRRAR